MTSPPSAPSTFFDSFNGSGYGGGGYGSNYPPSSPSSSSGTYYDSSSSSSSPSQFSILSNKIMIAAIITLFCVIFFVLLLHIYVRWIWRHPSSVNRRIHRINFSGLDLNSPLPDQNNGLDKTTIDQLPTFTYKAPKAAAAGGEYGYGDGNGVLECAVCLSEFEEDEKGRLLPSCKHSFHTDCIDMWFHSHSTCPLCRTVVMAPVEEGTVLRGFQHGESETRPGTPRPQPRPWLPMPQLVTVNRESMLTLTPPQLNLPGDLAQYPSNVLFWGNHTYVNSQISSPAPAFASASPMSPMMPPMSPSPSPPPPALSPRQQPRAWSFPRPLPHITIDIASPRPSSSFSFSTSASRCTSPHQYDHATSPQPLRSPGLRTTIKRMLSRQPSREKEACSSNEQAGDSSSKNGSSVVSG